MNLASLIREVPDFPVPGVLFRDITPLIADAAAFREAVARMCEPWKGRQIDAVVATEARGFIFGAPIALELGCGLVPVRKQGRLPWKTYSAEYTLEYRSDVLHVHRDALRPGQKVLLIDDLLATGGTSAAVLELVGKLGAEPVGAGFLIELAGLGGRRLLEGMEVHSLITFEGD